MENLKFDESILEEVFTVEVQVSEPIVVGQDNIVGRRQLIPILKGTISGPEINGVILPGGVDSQIIRPDGKCELSARYAVKLDDGAGIYIENNGIRTVPKECAADVFAGKFVDPDLYYFCTVPTFEVYSDKYKWLTQNIFFCRATRMPDSVKITFYKVIQ